LRWVPGQTWTIGTLVLLTVLTIVQIALDRQPLPRWTMKALALTIGALLLTFVGSVMLLLLHPNASVVLPLFPLLQPFALFLSWCVFLPVDRSLKHRVMERARLLRKAHPDLTVIGITGSVGKTTTKELLLHLLKTQGAHATPAYVNTEMGVAEWLTKELATPDPPRILIVEMGAYRPGEIALLCNIAKPTLGIITFIGTQHIALFGSQDALLKTKAELFQSLPADGTAILNADSPFVEALKGMSGCPTITVSTGEHADIEAFDIEETPTGIRFRIGITVFTIPLHGTHNVSNVLLAIAAAEALGMKRNEVARALLTFRPPEHTFAVRMLPQGVMLLDDSHNASPASFSAAINWAKTQPEEHKVLLTSGLIELGEEEDRVHAKLGTEAAGIFDRVIFTHARHARAFERGFGKPVEIFGKTTARLPSPSLLACIGRVPEEFIRRLLP
ncbi:MAG: UDP-N-acetylmuramoyl-tripeptide--D-alanyl-D-alanine ligase, partial [Candidatus Peribacteraceae bacterium]|nr:UDP-N-acetylmuramoyl-tripeptide--D-alanyl-D-alanine ligase [Candidatus Peribacteraceae bacterium]